jgi:hypothetical protein
LKKKIEGLKEVERAFVNVVHDGYREPRHKRDILELDGPQSLVRKLWHGFMRHTHMQKVAKKNCSDVMEGVVPKMV